MLLAQPHGRPAPTSPRPRPCVDEDDFYREGHRAVFRAIMDLFQVGEPVEPITVIEQLTKNGEPGRRPAAAVAVLDLMETPFIAASYRTYAEIVRDAATQRRLLQVGQQIEADDRPSARARPTAMLQDAETLVYELSQKGVRGDFTRAHELVIKGIERLTAAEESGGRGHRRAPPGSSTSTGVVGGLQRRAT